MKKNVLILIGIIAAFASLAYWLGTQIAPGSYPYAEIYTIDISEKDLITEIDLFKKDNIQYQVPPQIGLFDGKTDSMDYWFSIYFYYPETREILYTWVRAESKNKTKFAFVAISDGLTLGRWKDINKDLSEVDNKVQKEKFETLILDKIKGQIRK